MAAGKAAVAQPSVRFPVYEFAILFVPVALLIVLVGFSFASFRIDDRIEALHDLDSARLHRISGFIGSQVSHSLHLLAALRDEPVTRRAIESGSEQDRLALAEELLTLARRNPDYQQVRWIDETGMERVRAMRGDGEPYLVEAGELQDKSGRYYFRAAAALLPGELYVSPLDLNVEHGAIELPPRPTLRVATAVRDEGGRQRGTIVLNVAMNYLLRLIDNLRQEGEQAAYVLLNHEGMRLNATGMDLAGAGDAEDALRFANQAPEIWGAISAPGGTLGSGDRETWNGLWTWETLAPVASFLNMMRGSGDAPIGDLRLVADEFSLTLVAHRPIGALLEIRRDVRVPVSVAVLLALAIYGVSLYLYLNGHVKVRQAELQAAFASARAAHLERLSELEKRFHRLVEASSVGQLVVDADGTIEICNPAAEGMLGYSRGELDGKNVEQLVPEGLRERHQTHRRDYLKAPIARRMGEGRRLQALTRQGEGIAVEIGLNPYTDSGREKVLVTIIERSPRS